MRIGILSQCPELYSTRRLLAACQQRGHEAQIINPVNCSINVNSLRPGIHLDGQNISGLDAIIPRIHASITFYGCAVVRQFEMMGVYAANDSLAIARSRDKLRALQLLSRKGIDMPITGFASKPDDIPDLIQMVGGAPLVIKLLEGTQGIGVVLAETRNAAESVLEAFLGLKANILVQEFIQEAAGRDIRCFVVGDRVVAAMKRQGPAGDFRSNLHLGGTAEKVRITPQERRIAVAATKALGLAIAGVDMLRSQRGPLVLEVNSAPGIEGIELTTGIPVAEPIIGYIEKVVRGRKSGRPSIA